MEIWKSIKDYENIYEVSNRGRVRTAKEKTTYSSLHGERHWKQRILKQKTDKGGYKRVTLWKNKTPKEFLVHRLVAMSFISKIKGKDCVNHIDGNTANNYLENLEWCNYKENLIHAFDMRLNKSPDPIILFNKITKETHYFRSKATASKFLGRNHGYISNLIQKGELEIDEYEIYVRLGA